MLVLVEGKENTVWIETDNAVNINGFQATLAACGTLKTITDLSEKNPKFEFTPAESDMQWNEVYGELGVTDGEGRLYLKWLPQFKIVPAERAYEAVGHQKIVLSIASNYEQSYGGEGGGAGGGSGSGVTQEDLDRVLAAAKKYTDDNIQDVGAVVIENNPVEVQTQDGETVTMTVQEAVQQVQTVSDRMTEIIDKGLTGYTEDNDEDGQPDDGVLYLGFPT